MPNGTTARSPWQRAAPYVVWLVIGFAWATAFIVVRVGVAELPPFTFAAARTGLGAAVLLLLARMVRPQSRPRGSEFRFWAALGVIQIAVPYAALFWAAQFLRAGTTAILFATFPTFTALAAHVLVKDEPLTLLKLGGTLLALVAVGFLVNPLTGQDAPPFWPVVAVVGGVVFAAVGAVMVRRHGRHTSTLWLTAIQTASGGLMLLVLALAFERGDPVPLTAFTVGAVVYLALVVTVGCYLSLFWLLKRLDATFVAMGTILETALTVVLGAALLGESVGGRSLTGFVLVAISVGMVSFHHVRPALQDPGADRP